MHIFTMPIVVISDKFKSRSKGDGVIIIFIFLYFMLFLCSSSALILSVSLFITIIVPSNHISIIFLSWKKNLLSYFEPRTSTMNYLFEEEQLPCSPTLEQPTTEYAFVRLTNIKNKEFVTVNCVNYTYTILATWFSLHANHHQLHVDILRKQTVTMDCTASIIMHSSSPAAATAWSSSNIRKNQRDHVPTVWWYLTCVTGDV